MIFGGFRPDGGAFLKVACVLNGGLAWASPGDALTGRAWFVSLRVQGRAKLRTLVGVALALLNNHDVGGVERHCR